MLGFFQANDLIEVTRLCTGVLNSLASEQVSVLKELCEVCDSAIKAQWSNDDGDGGGGGRQSSRGGEKLREAFCSMAWAERMERQEELVKKYQVRMHAVHVQYMRMQYAFTHTR